MTPGNPIEIATRDGCRLQGVWWRGEGEWVVLLHDAGGDLDDWRPLPGWLEGDGWNVLAIDARGHGGSDGSWSEDTVGADVSAALGFALGRGAGRVYLGLGNCEHRRVCGELPPPGVAGVFAFGADVGEESCALRVPYLAICTGPAARSREDGAGRTQGRLTTAVYLPADQVGLDVLRGAWRQHACECVAAHLRLWWGMASAAAPRRGEVAIDAGD
jgi:pimeloyl-ACP methyl ester carboxylesterase